MVFKISVLECDCGVVFFGGYHFLQQTCFVENIMGSQVRVAHRTFGALVFLEAPCFIKVGIPQTNNEINLTIIYGQADLDLPICTLSHLSSFCKTLLC